MNKVFLIYISLYLLINFCKYEHLKQIVVPLDFIQTGKDLTAHEVDVISRSFSLDVIARDLSPKISPRALLE
jgi:hypothetical protein